jgi:hypothetical protein
MTVQPSIGFPQVTSDVVVPLLDGFDQQVVLFMDLQQLALHGRSKRVSNQTEGSIVVGLLLNQATHISLGLLHFTVETFILTANQCYLTSKMHRSTYHFLF